MLVYLRRMTKMEHDQAHGEGRRLRGPTINIDASVVSASQAVSTPTTDDNTRKACDLDGTCTSFPHNISSPTSKLGDRSYGFLTVPGARSRLNSFESDKTSDTSISYEDEKNAQTYFRVSALDDTGNKIASEGARNSNVINDKEALKPDLGTETDFEVENNKFAFSPGMLNKLLNPKSLSAFYALGGLTGLEKGLRTNRLSGLNAEETTLESTISYDDVKSTSLKTSPKPATNVSAQCKSTTLAKNGDGIFSDRKRVFSDNWLPAKKGKSLFRLMWITFNDKVLILLSIAATMSLGISLYQTFGTKHTSSMAPIEWLEGVAIIVTIAIVAVVGLLNDYQKERQFVKLIKQKRDRNFNVIRSGKSREVSTFDILVGDVVLVSPGDVIPADGIFIEGHNVKCNESQVTGDSNLVRKRPAEEVLAAIERGEDDCKLDPFILSGAQIIEGVGSFLATSTGINSTYGKILMSLQEDAEVTSLQSKLNTLAEYIAILGKALNFISALVFKESNSVRRLRACELMGNVTTFCSDKTSTLTRTRRAIMAGTKTVTGDGTNDAPALKRADVGFSMGMAKIESAKEAFVIILAGKNLVSILKSLRFGRAIKGAAKGVLQFQITVKIIAVLLAFIGAVSNATGEYAPAVARLFWVNLFMDTLAALAMATDPPASKGKDVGFSRNFSGFEEQTAVKKDDENKTRCSIWALRLTLAAFAIFVSILATSIMGGIDTTISHLDENLALEELFHVRLGDLISAIKCWITAGGPETIVAILAGLHLICGWAKLYSDPCDFRKRTTSLNQSAPVQFPYQPYSGSRYGRDDGDSYLTPLAKKETRALPKPNRQRNDHLPARSPLKHKRMIAKQLASALRCFMEQPLSGFLVLLPFIHGVAALDIPDPSIASMGSHTDAYLKAFFGALILLLSTFFAEHIPSLFGILMGALSIAWIPIQNDPGTSPRVYWAVFASWGVSTIIYGFAQFSKKKMGQLYVLVALVLTLALMGLNSQMHEKEDVVQGLIICFPPMLSLSIFSVSHIPTLLGWIETLAIHLGTSVVAIGRLPARRGEEDGNLEAGVLLRDTISNSPAA